MGPARMGSALGDSWRIRRNGSRSSRGGTGLAGHSREEQPHHVHPERSEAKPVLSLSKGRGTRLRASIRVPSTGPLWIGAHGLAHFGPSTLALRADARDEREPLILLVS